MKDSLVFGGEFYSTREFRSHDFESIRKARRLCYISQSIKYAITAASEVEEKLGLQLIIHDINLTAVTAISRVLDAFIL